MFEACVAPAAAEISVVRIDSRPRCVSTPPPEMQLDHCVLMCDDTGLFQHAIHSRAGPRARLLRRRQRPRAAAGLRAQRAGREAPARALTASLRRLRPACLESGARSGFAISWASTGVGSKTSAPRTATGGRSGRWANARAAIPIRRARTLGRRAVPRGAAGRSKLRLAAGLGIHLARARRLLRRP